MATAQALWTVDRGIAELRPTPLPAPREDEVVIRTLWSGLSRGTERLVFNGDVPPAEYARMRAPLMEGNFPFPVKYGYAAVGLVEDGPGDLMGKTVFALAPHQERLVVPRSLLAVVPAGVPARRATLTANMETALNAVWDSGAGPGDGIVVVGAGIVGLLITHLVAAIPGTEVCVIDADDSRQGIAQQLGAEFRLPDQAGDAADVVFHTSASAAGLSTALAAAGFEARVIEVSWYGDRPVAAPLGAGFHSQRLQLISSQVGSVATSRRSRWDYARRRDMALALLNAPVLDTLITEDIAFTDLAAAMPRLLAPGAPGLQTVIRYS